MKVDLVVARYGEDLGWIGGLSFNPRVFIYNKGAQLDAVALTAGGREVHIRPLPNVGRESHSYLHHIVTHHAAPADVTIFVQGRIDDLGSNIFPDLADYVAPALADGFAASAMELFFPWYRTDSDVSGRLRRDPRYARAIAAGQMAVADDSFTGFARRVAGQLPLAMVASFQGCFAVSRAAIQQHPVDFYAGLLAELGNHPNPEIGHYMERLWCTIFSGTTLRGQAIRCTLAKGLRQLAGLVPIRAPAQVPRAAG